MANMESCRPDDSATDGYRQKSRRGLTRAQRLTLLAVALVPIGFVLVELAAAVNPDTPRALQVVLGLLALAGTFVLLSGSLFSGMLALMAAKPHGSLFKGGRIAGLVALAIAFLLSLPFAAFLDFWILVSLSCRGGGECL